MKLVKFRIDKLFRDYCLIYLFIVIYLCSTCNNIKNKTSEKILEENKKYVGSLILLSNNLGRNNEHDKSKTTIFKAFKFSESNNYLSGELKSNYALCNYYFTFQMNDSFAYTGEKVIALIINRYQS